MPQSLWSFFAIQTALIRDKLYPRDRFPIHAPGPRRPDMQESEDITKVPHEPDDA